MSIGIDLKKLANKNVENDKLLLEKLKKKYKVIEIETKKLNSQIKNKKDAIAALQKEIQKYEEALNITTKNLNELKDILNSPLFSNELNKILFAIYKNNLKLVSLSKDKDRFIIQVASKDKNSYKIALFMQNLIKSGFKNVNSSFVKENNGLYISEVSCNE